MKNNLIEKLINSNFENQMTMYLSESIQYDKFTIYFSELIDDYYWNFANIKNVKTIKEFENIKSNIVDEFIKRKKIPVIYLTPISPLYNYLNDFKYEIVYKDSWLFLDNFNNYPDFKSKLSIEIKRVTEEEKEEFINAVSNGFASDDPNEPYIGLTEEYKRTLRNTFDNENILHYIAIYNNEIIGTLTAIIKNKLACIYNITTNKNYKRKGVCKELTSYTIKDLYSKTINQACL